MIIYCTEEFVGEFNNIKKKKNYRDFENVVLEYFLDNPFEKIATGDLLYGPIELPFIKKRIPDAGGYRLYFLADTNTKNIFINFVHPKKEPLGFENIGIIKKKELHDSICINRNNIPILYKLSRCPLKGIALFNPYEPPKKISNTK